MTLKKLLNLSEFWVLVVSKEEVSLKSFEKGRLESDVLGITSWACVSSEQPGFCESKNKQLVPWCGQAANKVPLFIIFFLGLFTQ